ncbi:3-oxoacyl-[acyl-carrier-protein] synthase, mitochondrial [Neocloeon triangulifer]|uniref:3-oxoacyl-[acyl-carrier-protein] synthase, mitochondrial n=1 Tax=Neocloeon triangulifer TaxID=2078957 RepID=UPI00286EC524|nr:3-oxoacyl-[acyl-carrier-protein] synthase, mitochondrial [Neocloeon triangulifer]XP_059480667.1 3-oxoacyl-[acyl-carrier-protein] synthase, mitochondrial [Neocloeon triangulifer]
MKVSAVKMMKRTLHLLHSGRSCRSVARMMSRWSSAALTASVPSRVVVTGMGVVSPLGCNLQHVWTQLLEGKSGITRLTSENFSKIPCQVAALVPRGPEEHQLDLDKHFSKSDLRTMAPATAYALLAAKEALQDSQWHPNNDEGRNSTGVSIGMGMVDLLDIADSAQLMATRGPNKVSPYFVPRILSNMAAGHLSIKYGFRGPNHCLSTACATGAHSIADSARLIREGSAKVMVCGGCEAAVNPLAVAAFCRLRALSTQFNNEPEKSSRPFDKKRDGFVMGEGAAVLILEDLDHAVDRGAKIYAEILGYGASGDANHPTAPSNDGLGASLAIRRALEVAEVEIEEVGHVNAHATSTPLGDEVEIKALRLVFGDHLNNIKISATKGAHGHLLGAAGALETVFTVMACQSGYVPPTLNLEEVPDDLSEFNFVAKEKQTWETDNRRIAIKNSFGFGGTNATLCVAQYDD